MKSRLSLSFFVVTLLAISLAFPGNGLRETNSDAQERFSATSSTFRENGTLPLSMIFTEPSASNPALNACTLNGAAGGDESPAVSWTGVPPHTASFVVTLYDTTASFTHWGIYNIPGTATGLAANAGAPGSTAGVQVSNDFGDVNYDGPCPPTSLTPLAHQYLLTVYALDTKLAVLPSSGNFPPGAEALYHAMLTAARGGHILGATSVTGYYSAAAPPGPADQ
jgi:Raf kinase inhibitor-like YbhB/YbcL family protein